MAFLYDFHPHFRQNFPKFSLFFNNFLTFAGAIFQNFWVTCWREQGQVTTSGGDMLASTREGDNDPQVTTTQGGGGGK